MPALIKFSAAALMAAAAFVALGCGSSPTPLPTPPAGAVVVSASNSAFEQPVVNADADAPFTIWFVNRENVLHNVNVLDAAGASQAKGDIFTGPAAQPLDVPPLGPGTYRLICDVHPTTMTAQLVAQ
jgi:plastocyanin